MRNKLQKFGIAFMAGLWLASCSAQPPFEATPAVWVMRDADTVIYLTGTVHLLPDNSNWQNGPVVGAINDAQQLVTELGADQLEQAPAVAQKYLYGPNAVPLANRLDIDVRDDFARLYSTQLNAVPRAERLDDWAMALMISQDVARNAGLEGDNGMDKQLVQLFKKQGKRRTGLETAADQFSRFDAIPVSEQRLMLNRLMRNIADDRADDELRTTVDAWARGDIDQLGRTIARDRRLAPATHRLMLAERNAIWANQLATRMDEPGRILIAVGAGHLAGPESLIALMQQKGFTVSRLQ